jgi:hypothetical protein
MKYRDIYLFVITVGLTLMATSSVSQALFGGEDDRKSIAGVLTPGEQETVEWTFKSKGGEILFASIDAEIYRVKTGEHETSITAAEGGGCEDEGGPGLFYIEVADQSGVICRADKPSPPPGWMRDPRLACKLPTTQVQNTYVLRVGLKTSEEQMQPFYSFSLNVSLRGIAPGGVNIQTAIGQSGNRF